MAPSAFACEAGAMRKMLLVTFCTARELRGVTALSRPLGAVPNTWRGFSGPIHS